MVMILDLAAAVAFRNVSDCSWINLVEQVMSLLNLALQHCGYAQKAYGDREIEQTLKRCNSMRALREEAEEDGEVQKLWLKLTCECRDIISKQFENLTQQGKPVHKPSILATKEDILTFQRLVVEEDKYKMDCTTKSEYQQPHMAAFKNKLKQGSLQ